MRSCALRLLPGLLTVALTSACNDPRAEHEHGPAVEVGLGPRVAPTPEPAIEPAAKPKLVVVVVVDQMRADYFERFGAQWQHGFVRLRDEGRVFASAYHEHAMTETAPGHATISTGCDPARHGILANSWLDRETGQSVNASDDPDASLFGSEGKRGSSPSKLACESVGDWLQAEQPEAVVISMAVKDRAAILLGGKRPDAAIWYDDRFGGFTTSSYYADAIPSWVTAYNEKGRAEALYGEQGWTLSRPDADYGESRRVTDPKLIATFSGFALTKEFPHVIADPSRTPKTVVRDTPFGDQMTFELARAAIEAERMGADAVPDLLLIGLSGGDYAGHRYGPNSVEIHDYYLRMDAALGEFIADLDERFGEDEYVLVLTADHGVSPMPEYSDIEGAGRFVPEQKVPALLERAVAELELGSAPGLELINGVELSFAAEVPQADRARLRERLAELLREEPQIRDAWTREELLGSEDRNEFAGAWRRSFNAERGPDIYIQFAPGVVNYPEGTGHGTPYEYDQHVPLLIRGAGWSGVAEQRVSTVDIAPTIAALVGVEPAASIDGHAIAPE